MDREAFAKRYGVAAHEYTFGRPHLASGAPLENYAALQASLPIYCVDVFAINPIGRVLLGLRKAKPVQGMLWTTGGRKYRNERMAHCAARHFHKDFQVDIDEGRFGYLDHACLYFDEREQDPQDVGADCPVAMLGLLLTQEESDAIREMGELQHVVFMEYEEAQHKAEAYICRGLELLRGYYEEACELQLDRP